MYSDTIKAENKVISDKDLVSIFEKMNDDATKNMRIYKQECNKNENIDWKEQFWTLKDFEYRFTFRIDFYDNTDITIDNYPQFLAIFNSRLPEIKYLWCDYTCHYFIQNGSVSDYVRQSISMNIRETDLDISVDLSSKDKIMNDIYELIKEKIQKAPKKYDRIIREKSKIRNKIEFAFGSMFSIGICTLLILVPSIRELYILTYILYPLAVIILGMIIGTIFFDNKLDSLYSTIVPNKKYSGFDSKTYESIYKDDIDSYTNTSEIIIGKNVNNIKNRIEIRKLEKKYSQYLPFEIAIILIISIAFIVINIFNI